MGVRTWGAGLVAAAVIAASGASGAPVVAAQGAQSAADEQASPRAHTFNLPGRLADANVAGTAQGSPDKLVGKWPCDLPINIYYAGAPSIHGRDIVRQLEYPVEYLRSLGYKVNIVREVAYQADYHTPTTPGDVLLIVPTKDGDKSELVARNLWAMSVFVPSPDGLITSAEIVVDGVGGLSSGVLLHELGHVIGLDHKPGTVMAERAGSVVNFDAGETAAVDCR